MIGSIIGDIVGSIFEFDNIKTKEFPLFTERTTTLRLMTVVVMAAQCA